MTQVYHQVKRSGTTHKGGTIMADWRALGIRPADILIPRQPYLTSRWPVVALDQYTSQPEVWRAAEAQVGEAPSTLRLVVPEAFLEETEVRSEQVYQAMEDYLARDIFDTLQDSFVLVERQTQSGSRVGLVLTIDLEQYDYAPGSSALIRATEQTVLERIPPRLQVRERSALEISHVMLLVDDKADSLLGPLFQQRASLTPVYDLELLMDGGRVRGWQVDRAQDHEQLNVALRALKDQVAPGGLLFAVGDGNHSLAAAKASWDKQKVGLSEGQREAHIARFALVELVNLHSPALLFEPIHRIAFGADSARLLQVLDPLGPREDQQAPDITLVGAQGDLPLKLTRVKGLVTDAVQQLLDEARLPLDYVHGIQALRDIAASQGGTGILMPDFPKDQLFPTVQTAGRLPRKTFSMGEANEKRFYLEARKIR